MWRIGLNIFVRHFLLPVTALQGNFVDVPSSDEPILALADEETVLPCHYQPEAGVQVVQVTWYKENSDDTKEQIITAHQTNGQTGVLSLLFFVFFF